MALSLAYVASGSAIADAGLFIPVSVLPGVTVDEIESANFPVIESKFVYGYLNKLFNYVSNLPAGFLGFNFAKASPVGSGNDLINQNFSFTGLHRVDLSDGTIKEIPASYNAVSNPNAPRAFSFTDVFPGGSVNLAANANAPADGFSIPRSALAAFSGFGLSLNGNLFANPSLALFYLSSYIASTVTLRTNDAPSAVLSSTRNNPTIFSAPAAFASATNPTTGLTQQQVNNSVFFNVSRSITLQVVLDQTTQTFDVNVPNNGVI